MQGHAVGKKAIEHVMDDKLLKRQIKLFFFNLFLHPDNKKKTENLLNRNTVYSIGLLNILSTYL